MSITTQDRSNISKLVVAMFNAAPGATYLAELSTALEAGGHDFRALAVNLSHTAAYKAINPDSQTAAQFAAAFLTPLGLQANHTALDFITQKFGTMSKGQIALEAAVALDASTSDEFAQARAVLDHKAEVAVFYSVDLAVAESSVPALQAVLHGVDSTAASVTEAKAALQPAEPEPTPPGPTEPGGPASITVNLTAASDTYTTPTPDSYTINGFGGNDTITTGAGSSTVTTLAGNDTITTGAGNDVIRAGEGDNTVTAGDGTNSVVSGAGNDTITTGAGTDSITTGAGNDTITAGLQLVGQRNTVTGGAGGDLINFTAGENTRFVFSGSDSTTAAVPAPGYGEGNMDTLGATGLISNAASWADGTAGARITLATGVSATAVAYGTAAVVYGDTLVAHAGDYYVFDTQAAGVAYVYQDTNRNSTIDAGEFAVKLMGSAGAFSDAEFSISGGNLLYTSGV